MEERNQSTRMAFGVLYGKPRTMSFLPELKSYLKDNGFIYTVRKYKMSDAIVEVDGIGECHRIPIKEVEERTELEPYWAGSGFISLDLWWNKIKYFIPNKNDPMYLYKVEVASERSI